MQFAVVSIIYVFAVLILFYSLRTELRLYILCAASIIYPFFLGQVTGIVVIAVSMIIYVGGLLIGYLNAAGKKRLSRLIVITTIIAIAGSMLSLKYSGYLQTVFHAGGFFKGFLFAVAIPVGFSFYGFQAISYVLDVYNEEIPAEKNIVLFHVYMAWFPKFISGPIERTDEFVQQFHGIRQTRLLNADRIKKSASYVLLGCFYKMVVADRIAILIGGVFSSPENYSRLILVLASVLFTVQIYCDFAGYSMFAIGVSELFGIKLTENFNAPYLSHNINEFWDRWHISLSRWLKKYIYIPLGGNRKGTGRKYLNIMIVFLVSGIWHGAGAGYIVWGLLHGIYSVIDNLIVRSSCRRIREGFLGRCTTFVFVSFAWIFFCTSSARGAIHYIWVLLMDPGETGIFNQLLLIEKNKILDIIILAVAILIMVVFDSFIYKRTLKKLIEDMSLVRWCMIIWIGIFLVAVFGVYGPDLSASRLIYMQF